MKLWNLRREENNVVTYRIRCRVGRSRSRNVVIPANFWVHRSAQTAVNQAVLVDGSSTEKNFREVQVERLC